MDLARGREVLTAWDQAKDSFLDVDWKRAHENRGDRAEDHAGGTMEYRLCESNGSY